MFGYGFGFVGVMLLMMQEIAPGKYQTAHYAFANSLMNLGLMIPGAVSGKIQMALGYQKFFVLGADFRHPGADSGALHSHRTARAANPAAPDPEVQPSRV